MGKMLLVLGEEVELSRVRELLPEGTESILPEEAGCRLPKQQEESREIDNLAVRQAIRYRGRVPYPILAVEWSFSVMGRRIVFDLLRHATPADILAFCQSAAEYAGGGNAACFEEAYALLLPTENHTHLIHVVRPVLLREEPEKFVDPAFPLGSLYAPREAGANQLSEENKLRRLLEVRP